MKKVKIGIIGSGNIAKMHYDGFKNLENVELCAMTKDFYGSDEEIKQQRETLKEQCKKWKMTPYFSYEEMLDQAEIDAVIILTISCKHHKQALQALEKGKHVLLEKPICLTLDEIDELKEAAEKNKCTVFPAHVCMYSEGIIKAKELIENDKIGRIIFSSFLVTQIARHSPKGDYWRRNKKLAGGGALMDSGHHLAYQAIYLFGMPKRIQAFCNNIARKHWDSEDIAQVNMVYADGSIGGIVQSFSSPYSDEINGIRILGEKGNIAIIDNRLFLNGEEIYRNDGWYSWFKPQAESFIDCILNKTPPRSNLDDARNALDLILSAYESSEKGIVIYK